MSSLRSSVYSISFSMPLHCRDVYVYVVNVWWLTSVAVLIFSPTYWPRRCLHSTVLCLVYYWRYCTIVSHISSIWSPPLQVFKSSPFLNNVQGHLLIVTGYKWLHSFFFFFFFHLIFHLIFINFSLCYSTFLDNLSFSHFKSNKSPLIISNSSFMAAITAASLRFT